MRSCLPPLDGLHLFLPQSFKWSTNVAQQDSRGEGSRIWVVRCCSNGVTVNLDAVVVGRAVACPMPVSEKSVGCFLSTGHKTWTARSVRPVY
jgi:hypothetical protein